VLWMVESLERHSYAQFELTISNKKAPALRSRLEHMLAQHHARAELRTLAPDEMTYSVRVPVGVTVDRLSDAIVGLDRQSVTSVEWDEKRQR
jgi:hypothetical protein